MFRRYLGVVVCSLGLVSPTILAEDAPHVYTNADLEHLEPIPTSEKPIADGSEDLGWKFVFDFIDREHKRLDANRSYELERSLVNAEVHRLEADSRRLLAPYGGLLFPSYGYGYGPDVGHGVDRRPGSRAAGLRPAVPDGSTIPFRFQSGGRIIPFHARPGGLVTPLHARPAPRQRAPLPSGVRGGGRRGGGRR